ncbi:acyl-CoA N-acyltransferase [Whalleya microplaca]|nr:acyl-CoA N-acyltransferase [Whalleya microplaca]
MAFTLRKATISDIPGIVDAHNDSFRDHPLSKRVLDPSSEHVHEFWNKSLKDELVDPNADYIVMTDPASSPPEKVVGFAKWIKPLTPESPPSPAPHPWPEGADLAFADTFFGTIDKYHEDTMKGRPHWYLSVLGTRREYQGKGIGKELVRWGTSRADEDGAEAFVAASPAGVHLYKKMGFEALDEIAIEGVTYLETLMLRKPNKSQQQG